MFAIDATVFQGLLMKHTCVDVDSEEYELDYYSSYDFFN